MEKCHSKITNQLTQKDGGKILITGETNGDKDILETTLRKGETLEIKQVDRSGIKDLSDIAEIYEKSMQERKKRVTKS